MVRICAGKSSIASYLVEEHHFKRIRLARTAPTPTVEKSASDVHVPPAEPSPIDAQYTFSNVDTLLEFVTLRWREHWVTTDIWDEKVVDALIRRPFFLLVSVDAPVSVRWQRFKDRCASTQLTPPSLSDFVLRNDAHLFAPTTGLQPLFERAHLKLLNSTTSLPALHAALRPLNLPNDARLRPSWDQYFMQLADLAAHRSNCMKRRVGCVIVREKRVISTGYNGTPRGMTNCNEGGCPRCNTATSGGHALSTCLCLHAEENALLEAGRDRINSTAILYCNTCPCLTCSVKITQVGISEVVYNQGYMVDTKTAEILLEGGVKLRQFSPMREGLVDLSLGVGKDAVGGAEEGGEVGDVREVLGDETFVRPLR
ncbi:Deoxycytidine monophosphate (dCMP) deaminase [Paraconiothyrium brasiliense]|uniref:dCMP deaminase n=1 Tax=Paraconiothyrium brasiliense TaxID=300254 RepID=A0ABR3QT09_9PLEO